MPEEENVNVGKDTEPPVQPQTTEEVESDVTGQKRPRPTSGGDKPPKPRKKYAKELLFVEVLKPHD
ncbi:unnamed protein product [Arabidopsis lyrata]|nr:unnamed protein product [Arabidopsis lyrata]